MGARGGEYLPMQTQLQRGTACRKQVIVGTWERENCEVAADC
jgi:hypothetical protein